MKISFIIDGEPIAQKRHRHHRWGVYDPSAKDKQTTKLIIKPHIPHKKLRGAIVLHLHFFCQRPKYHYRTGKFSHIIKDKYKTCFHIVKKDIDNIAKFYLDLFTLVGIWEDDCQVIQLSCSKKYADSKPRTEVMIVEV
tara:strand:+ start:6002 stop:6415 length:414 start_codon:yes stop_codon:yes gene_type:complete